MKDHTEWFETNKELLEGAYLNGKTPWERSGVGLHTPRTEEYWRVIRQPIPDLIDRSGSVLDIGCANGYLLQSLELWLGKKGIIVEPFGLDTSEPLLEEARHRLPHATFYNANVWGWKAPRRYDFVLTELEYVPSDCQEWYLRGLLEEALSENGKLIVSRYSSDAARLEPLTERIRQLGFEPQGLRKAIWDGAVKTESVSLRSKMP